MSGVAEVLVSIQVVQAFAREDYEDRRFKSESRQNVRAGLQARSVKAKLLPIVDVFVAVGTCLVLGYGVRLVSTGQLSTGVLIVFLMYLKKTYKPLRDLSKMANTLSKAAVLKLDDGSGSRRRRQRDRDRSDAEVAPPFKGLVEFDHITFRYNDDVTCTERCQPPHRTRDGRGDRRTVGAGQEHDRGLLPRFFDPVAGAVKIDGRDIREYTLKSLRDQIILFCRTLCCSVGRSGRTSATASLTPTPKPLSSPRSRPTRMTSSWRCPTGTARWSPERVKHCPADSAAASPSRARSSATPRSWFLTSQRLGWMWRYNTR